MEAARRVNDSTVARVGAVARERWRVARRFQMDVQRALSQQGVTFMEWLLLQTIEEMYEETPERVSQSALAHRTGLSRAVVSYWMREMEEYGMVDRGEHYDPRAWSVILSGMGRLTLQRCNERLEAAGLNR